ncbi:hypothetical protein UlMin_018034 [Ulmus minor]
MEGEISKFITIWISVLASLCYCHTIGKITKQGTPRLLAILPIIILFLLLPLNLTTVFLGGPTSFIVSWLATFKLLLFSFGKGPLSSNSNPPLPLPRFISLACFPIKLQNDNPSPQNDTKCHKSPLNYTIKILLYSTILPVYRNKEFIDPKLFLFFYSVYTYISLEIILAICGSLARAILGVELEPQFDEPYLSTSLQDFWGRRWNLIASGILRPTVYEPIRSISSRWMGKKWAPLPAVIASFAVSALMHELIFYHLGRSKPTGGLTCFFLLHGVCLAIEIGIKKSFNGKWSLPRAVSGVLAMSFVMVTGLLLFAPTLMRIGADVRGNKEILAFIEFLKSLTWNVFGFKFDKFISFSSSF